MAGLFFSQRDTGFAAIQGDTGFGPGGPVDHKAEFMATIECAVVAGFEAAYGGCRASRHHGLGLCFCSQKRLRQQHGSLTVTDLERCVHLAVKPDLVADADCVGSLVNAGLCLGQSNQVGDAVHPQTKDTIARAVGTKDELGAGRELSDRVDRQTAYAGIGLGWSRNHRETADHCRKQACQT